MRVFLTMMALPAVLADVPTHDPVYLAFPSSPSPSGSSSPSLSLGPSRLPTLPPTPRPSPPPTPLPTNPPTSVPTKLPTPLPTPFPTPRPTTPPTPLPTLSPTSPPTPRPSPPPSPFPTMPPTPVPTNRPTPLPTSPPTGLPTLPPTPLPTKSPTRLPTAAPTLLPTQFPTPLPTSLPTVSAGVCACSFPPYLTGGKFSLITQGNALLSAHNVYVGIAVGGTLTVWEPNTSKTVGGMSYFQAISPSVNYNVNFNGGKQIIWNPLSAAGVDFSVLECLARNAKSYEANGYKVVVFTKGGTYTMDDLRPSWFQDYDKGKTLAIFNTSENVRLAVGAGGRKFGPSVLAPFSEVTIDDNNAFNDGYVVAKTFRSTQTYQQLHGAAFNGGLQCV